MGLSWWKTSGSGEQDLVAGNQEERGKGQSRLQRRISWLRTEGVLSNCEVAAAGWGAVVSSRLLFGEAGG